MPVPLDEASVSDEVEEQCSDCGTHLILEKDPNSEALVLVCPACLHRVREIPPN